MHRDPWAPRRVACIALEAILAAGRGEVTWKLERLLDRINREVAIHERLSFIAVAKDRWTVEDGSLTPSMKLKRSVIEARYAPALPRWYAAGRKVVWED